MPVRSESQITALQMNTRDVQGIHLKGLKIEVKEVVMSNEDNEENVAIVIGKRLNLTVEPPKPKENGVPGCTIPVKQAYDAERYAHRDLLGALQSGFESSRILSTPTSKSLIVDYTQKMAPEHFNAAGGATANTVQNGTIVITSGNSAQNASPADAIQNATIGNPAPTAVQNTGNSGASAAQVSVSVNTTEGSAGHVALTVHAPNAAATTATTSATPDTAATTTTSTISTSGVRSDKLTGNIHGVNPKGKKTVFTDSEDVIMD
ncbi:hypothetical protein BGX21_000908 [Mortierella sp. AD011]|nr:hypothetical protein BGX20_001219 [Mortierella sp. AD010]KAF9386050.1 hypothetical protein BGX21_000908 [Mortierella sp. AD011]